MEESRHQRPDPRDLSLSIISTYPPTRCGIGRFSHSLVQAIKATSPATRVGVAKIASEPDGTPDDLVEVAFDPTSPVARRTAARRVNQSDAVVLQHEYGLYGPDDGVAVVDLVHRIEAPLVSVMHTVRTSPSPRQREIIEVLGRAGVLVVLSHVARHQLLSAHDVDPAAVDVIPHGSPWAPAPPPPGPRRRLISWGLLGPGKGIERALHAMARVDLDPPVTYDIVGQTHPNVLALHGQDYRLSLERLAERLGLGDRVRFHDRYMADPDLERMAAAADLVVLPYDNDEQVCSGVLTDAIALGRPVVATAFPHAREFAAQGCGRAVGYEPVPMARAIEEMLTDEKSYQAACAAASRISPSLSWPGVATAYLQLAGGLRASVVA